MKAWIYIGAICIAAGWVTALADEIKTNAQTWDATTSTNTNEAAIAPPVATPAVTNVVKPPVTMPAVTNAVKPPVAIPAVTNTVKLTAIVPRLQTSAVPVQSNITAATQTLTKVVTPLPMTATSAPAPAIASGVKPPDIAPSEQTSAVPAQPDITVAPQTPTNAAAPPPESSGNGHKSIWAGGMVFLVLAGGLAIFVLRRFRAASQGSLITSAMNENQKNNEDKNAPPPLA
jgi:hypothetical protein